MPRELVRDESLPKAVGHYSPVVKVGELLFLSAQTGIDQEIGRVPEGGFEEECRQAFVNIDKILSACGSSLGDVVRTTVLYTDLDYLPIVNRVFADIFPFDPPARTAAIVGLAGGRRISIDAIAVAGGGSPS